MPSMKKLTEYGAYVANAQSIFNIITALPEPVRSRCQAELATGIDEGVLLSLAVGAVLVDEPVENQFRGILHFGKDRIKTGDDKEFIKILNACRHGLFKTWEHIYQLLACYAPTSLSKMQVYALDSSIPFGRMFVNKDMIVFTYSKSDAYQINDTDKAKKEFKSFLDKVMEPVPDIDYGEPYVG